MMNDLTTAAGANTVDTVRTPEIVAAEIRALTASMLNNVIEIGRRLTEAKEMLPHGAFGSWVTEQTAYSLSTANNFMRLYQEYGEDQGSLFGAGAKSQTIGNLPYSKALALLALPAGEREEFAETPHTVDGQEKTVDEMTTRELKRAIQERDEAVAEKDNAYKAAKSAEAERDALKAQLETAREQAKKAAGSAALSADAELAQFKLLFDGIQTDINKLTGLLMKVRLRDAESAKKLTAALNALADKIREEAAA